MIELSPPLPELEPPSFFSDAPLLPELPPDDEPPLDLLDEPPEDEPPLDLLDAPPDDEPPLDLLDEPPDDEPPDDEPPPLLDLFDGAEDLLDEPPEDESPLLGLFDAPSDFGFDASDFFLAFRAAFALFDISLSFSLF